MSLTIKKNSALTVAEYFINKSNSEKKPITNKKLQKLLYYAQVWSYTVSDKKIFKEKIEAWVHGPVVPEVYFEYKSFGFNPIKLDTSEIEFDKVLSEKQIELLDTIWILYGKYDAPYLEALTHSELPWQDARKDVSPVMASDNEIDLKLAKKFYGAKLRPKTA